jgi:hypothetical protein
MRRISGIAVSEELYQQVVAAKNRGSKCYLVRPEVVGEGDPDWMHERAESFCLNCHGVGSIGFQLVVGGPYNHVPNTAIDKGPRATFIDGAWYLQKTRESTCPICGGTGAFTKMPEASPKVVF